MRVHYRSFLILLLLALGFDLELCQLSESIPVEPFEPIRALGGNGKAQKATRLIF